jgi:hypothetical protein
MIAFGVPVDIANRALQHCGVTNLIDATLGFSEVSTNAAQTSFCYDKLRRAELRRNMWVFATKRAVLRAIDTNTRLVTPALWSAVTTYFVGSIAADQYGTLWVSKIPSNLNNDPLNSVGCWQQYFGPLTVSLFASGTTYFAGEMVYTTAGDGTYRVYLSLVNNNADVPATATAYDATVTYTKNQVVTYLSVAYMSRIDFNLAQTPTSSAANWASGTTYVIGNSVTGSDGFKYTSLVNGNVGNDPTTDAGTNWTNTGVLTPWTTVFTGGTGSLNWLEVGGAEFPNGVALSPLAIVYPLSAGPSTQIATRNAFKLPANYLRTPPQDPKAGASTYLGAPSNLAYSDWVYESGFIVSRQADPIVLRFIADISDVTLMDDMFCEGLAARIGLEVCEPITQSTDKLKTIAALYKQTMTDARLVNAIETGSDQPPLDDFLACRI